LREAELIKKELPDVSTDKGRKAIASAARKVSSSKVAIEKPGAIYTKKIKSEGAEIAAELSAFKKAMDVIRDDVQAPLIAYKEAEGKRIEGLEAEIEAVKILRVDTCPETFDLLSSEALKSRRTEVAETSFCKIKFGDMHESAVNEWSKTLDSLDISIIKAVKSEEIRADNERLKAESDELRIQARVKEEAAEQVSAEKLKSEKAVQDALEDVRKQDARKLADANSKRAAEILAANDLGHRKEVNNRALNELMQCCEGLTNDQAMKIVKGMASGNFTDLTINY
jgi:hypothetical protein